MRRRSRSREGFAQQGNMRSVETGEGSMNRRPGRETGRDDNDQSSMNLARLFGQMFMLPLTVFVYGMELFVQTLQGVQSITDDGLDVMTDSVARPRDGATGRRGDVTNEARAGGVAEASGQWANVPSGQPTEAGVATTPATPGGDAGRASENKSGEQVKEAEMDRDLRDDMLKLVRYKVLFVKREYEHAFPEQEDLVSENMDGAAFTAWKVAEFIQVLGRGEMRVPHKWAEKGYPGGGHVRDGLLLGLRDSDKKYLRVYYEVMDRYPREKFKYEEQQIRVLEQIRDEIHECDDK
ncbi:MAG TPA: hypothetical protein VF703_08550 [Pyrinomonadaceae bacterium]